EAAAGGPGGFEIPREVDVVQGAAHVGQRPLAADLLGEDFGDVGREAVDGVAEDRPQLVGAEVLGERVNRDDLAATGVGRLVEDLHTRAGHLPAVAVPLRLAAEGDALAVAEAAGGKGLVEPDALQADLAAVAENDADDRAAVGQAAAVDLDHLA